MKARSHATRGDCHAARRGREAERTGRGQKGKGNKVGMSSRRRQ
jgi:hypothetical protein